MDEKSNTKTESMKRFIFDVAFMVIMIVLFAVMNRHFNLSPVMSFAIGVGTTIGYAHKL